MDLLNKTIVGPAKEPSSTSVNIQRFPSIQIDGSTVAESQLNHHDDLDARFKAMQRKIFLDVVKAINVEVKDFLKGDEFADKLESYVGNWLTVMNTTTQHEVSQLNESAGPSQHDKKIAHPMLEERLAALEETVAGTTNPALDKANTRCESLEKDIANFKKEMQRNTENNAKNELMETRLQLVENQITVEIAAKNSKIEIQEAEINDLQLTIQNLKVQFKEIQKESDRTLIEDISKHVNKTLLDHHTNVISPLITTIKESTVINAQNLIELEKHVQEQVQQFEENLTNHAEVLSEVLTDCETFRNDLDAQEQYGRHELLDFEGIPQGRGENTTKVIVDFLRKYLDIEVTEYDISISHRMVIPPEKKKYGRDYIPPIYCKFLNRSLVHLILSKRHLLKRHQNPNHRQKLAIQENLTLVRRTLKEKAEKELKTYKFKWVKNGNIMVRKNRFCPAVKVNTEEALNHLIEEQKKDLTPDTIDAQMETSIHAHDLASEAEKDSTSHAASSNNTLNAKSTHQETRTKFVKDYYSNLPINTRLLELSNMSLHTSRALHPSSFASAHGSFKPNSLSISQIRKYSDHV